MRLDRLKELTTSERRVLAAVACVIGVLVVHHEVVGPHLAALHAAQRYEHATHAMMEEGKAQSRQLQVKRLALERMRSEQAALAEGIFPPAEVEPFIGVLEQMCVETQCTLSTFVGFEVKSGPTRRHISDANAPAVRKTARLVLQARYPDLVRLLDKLQTYRRKIWIDDLRISAPAGVAFVACDLDISIYIFRSKENDGHE